MGSSPSIPITKFSAQDFKNGMQLDEKWARKYKSVEILDLSNMGLAFVPSSLKLLSNLTSLKLSRNQMIESLNVLESLQNLKILYLVDCSLSSLKGIEVATSLEELFLQKNLLNTLNEIKSLTNLRKLNIADNQFLNIEGIGCFEKLEYLSIQGNDVSLLPDEMGKLQELEEFVGCVELITLPSSMYELERLHTITLWDTRDSLTCRIVLNFTLQNSFDFRYLLPYLSRDNCQDILVESLLYPPIELGSIKNLKTLYFGSMSFTKENNQWFPYNFEIKDEYHFLSFKPFVHNCVYVIGEMGKLYSIPAKLYKSLKLSTSAEDENPLNIISFKSEGKFPFLTVSGSDFVWLIDDEQNLWINYNTKLCKIHDIQVEYLHTIDYPQSVFPIYFAIIGDCDGYTYWLRVISFDKFDVLKSNFKAVSSLKILGSDYVAINLDGTLEDGKVDYGTLIFETCKIHSNLPKFTNKIFSYSEKNAYMNYERSVLVIDENGTPWGKGENSLGILGLGDKKTVKQWTALPISNISFIKMESSRTLFISDEGDVYGSGYCKYPEFNSRTPILLDAHLPIPWTSKKSARK